MTEHGRYVIVIGAMKSGTTTLFHLLEQHPQIAGCRLKEPNFFGDAALFRRGFDWYAGLWPKEEKSKWRLEASTFYTKWPYIPGVPERIMAAINSGAEIRLIYIMRRPAERVRSHLNHVERNGSPFVAARQAHPLDDYLVDLTRYATQLDQYRRGTPSIPFHLMSLEELHRDPEGQVMAIHRFLDIAEIAPRPIKNRNVGSDLGGAPRIFHKLLRSRLFHRNYHRLPDSLRRVGRRLLFRRRDRAVEISAADERRLERRLRKDMQRLSMEYGFDTSIWAQMDGDD